MDPRSSISLFSTTPDGRKNCYTFKMFGLTIATTVTNDPQVVAHWIHTVENIPDNHYVGFDIEFDVKTTRIGTLQFCVVSDQCLIFQPQKPALPPALVQFLVGGTHKFISMDAQSKIQLLMAEFPFAGAVDVAEFRDITPFMTNLMQRELDTIALEVEETEWDRYPSTLSDKQVHYACVHAFLNLFIVLRTNPPAIP